MSRLSRRFNHMSKILDHRAQPSRPRSHRPLVQLLEDRLSPAVLTWTGDQDNNWNSPGNWKEGAIVAMAAPTAMDDVVIPQISIAKKPIVATAAAAKSVTVQAGGRLQLNANITLTVSGDFRNSGARVTLDGVLNVGSGEVINEAAGQLQMWGGSEIIASTVTNKGIFGNC